MGSLGNVTLLNSEPRWLMMAETASSSSGSSTGVNFRRVVNEWIESGSNAATNGPMMDWNCCRTVGVVKYPSRTCIYKLFNKSSCSKLEERAKRLCMHFRLVRPGGGLQI